MLYVVDQANFRVAVIDTRSRQVVASVKVGRLPFAMTLSADRRKLYVTNLGMFEYQAIPGADAKQAGATGLAFPAFGFPSAEAAAGAERATERGPVKVPGLGDPNVRESNSVSVVDVSTPTAPKVETFVRTGLPFGADRARRQQPLRHPGRGRAGLRLQRQRRHHHGDRRQDHHGGSRDPDSHPGPGTLSRRAADRPGVSREIRLAAGGGGGDQRGRRDRREAAARAGTHSGRLVSRRASSLDQDTVFVANGRGFGQGPNAPARAGAARLGLHFPAAGGGRTGGATPRS